MKNASGFVTALLLTASLLAGCAAPTPEETGTAWEQPAAEDGLNEIPDEIPEEPAGETRMEVDMKRRGEVKEPVPAEKKPEPEESPRTPVLTDENGAEYSADTLIVMLDPETDETAARTLAQRHGLEILYLYKSFSSMAVKTPGLLTAEEMDTLAAALEAEDIVTAVNRDYITRLDDPVTIPEVMG